MGAFNGLAGWFRRMRARLGSGPHPARCRWSVVASLIAASVWQLIPSAHGQQLSGSRRSASSKSAHRLVQSQGQVQARGEMSIGEPSLLSSRKTPASAERVAHLQESRLPWFKLKPHRSARRELLPWRSPNWVERRANVIGPGALCFVIECDNIDWIGRVVVTGQRVFAPRSPVHGQWEVFAHWLPPADPCWYAQPWCLKPILNWNSQSFNETSGSMRALRNSNETEEGAQPPATDSRGS